MGIYIFLIHCNIELQLLMTIYDLIMMSYINSYSCYENPQDSSYRTGKGAHTWRLKYTGLPVRWLKGNGSLAKGVC
jgi:hypothetical protein